MRVVEGDVSPAAFAAGHVPGAVLIPAEGIQSEDGELVSVDVLRDIYSEIDLADDGRTRVDGA